MWQEKEVAKRLKNFSLSEEESKEVELHENDTKIGYEEGGRSLIEKIVGERKPNFSRVRNAMTKRWGQKELSKVIMLEENVF